MKYNAVLRAFTEVPRLQQDFEQLCRGNMYATTLHCINSAIIKVGATDACSARTEPPSAFPTVTFSPSVSVTM